MTAYELDDEKVRAYLNNSAGTLPGYLFDALSAQLPIPAPGKIGAVVKTVSLLTVGELFREFMRWTTDAHSHSPWIEVSNHEEPFRTDEIGRIVEVLSEGVDL